MKWRQFKPDKWSRLNYLKGRKNNYIFTICKEQLYVTITHTKTDLSVNSLWDKELKFKTLEEVKEYCENYKEK